MSADSRTTAEVRYLRSSATFDLICKEEDTRQQRVRSLLLKGDLNDVEDKLSQEIKRAEQAEHDAQRWQDNSERNARRLEREEGNKKARAQELESLKAETLSLQTISADSKMLLTEKLALSRDLANLKPELEHLRSQVSSHEKLLAEKLALQQELSNYRAELADAKRSMQRLQQREDKVKEQESEYVFEIQELKNEIAGKKRKEEKSNGRIEELNEQLEQLRNELEKEKHLREKSEKVKAAKATATDQISKIKDELQAEKQSRANAEKQLAKSAADWEAEKAAFDDKLDQFRTKLRSTKETLKETQTALQEAQNKAANVPSDAPAKKGRKRGAAHMDPDAAIGTPGDAGPNKRSKRSTSVLGEKSNFSITPFLNRTTSIAPDSPKDADEPMPSIEGAASPSIRPAKPASIPPVASSTNPTPLEPTSNNVINKQPAASNPRARNKVASSSTLEIVAEEDDVEGGTETAEVASSEQENIAEVTSTTVASTTNNTIDIDKVRAPRLSLKPKKSLSSFASFRDGSLPPERMQKKKRKLLGGVGGAKTIFDEDEDGEGEGDGDAVSLAGGRSSVALGGQRAFGAFGAKRALGGLATGLLSGAQRKGPLVVANDGFMFSPLKRQRKAMAATVPIATEG